jgi:uncharacterized protein with HEPN domain
MSFEPHDYLRHILVEADYLVAQGAGLNRDDFMANETLRRAFVRSLEIIGEAAKKVPDEFRAKPGQSCGTTLVPDGGSTVGPLGLGMLAVGT